MKTTSCRTGGFSTLRLLTTVSRSKILIWFSLPVLSCLSISVCSIFCTNILFPGSFSTATPFRSKFRKSELKTLEIDPVLYWVATWSIVFRSTRTSCFDRWALSKHMESKLRMNFIISIFWVSGRFLANSAMVVIRASWNTFSGSATPSTKIGSFVGVDSAVFLKLDLSAVASLSGCLEAIDSILWRRICVWLNQWTLLRNEKFAPVAGIWSYEICLDRQPGLPKTPQFC